MREYEVINYHMEQYQMYLEQNKLFKEWKTNNPDEYAWNYKGKNSYSCRDEKNKIDTTQINVRGGT